LRRRGAVVVTIRLQGIFEVTLKDFNVMPAIIYALEIKKVEGGYRFDWDSSYGTYGSIDATQARIALTPGKP
jgi:hypothetical protein